MEIKEVISGLETIKDINVVHGKCLEALDVAIYVLKDLALKNLNNKEDIIMKKNFGFALEVLKQGGKVARKGWNGKGMFVVYQKGYPEGIPCNKQTALAWGLNEGDLFKCNPYLQIRCVDGSHSMWVPSINDVLAEDWEIVHNI